ncbi:MAG: ABC transporter substrate-binding protein [Sphaerochaetaceae bacterium]|nr:ABC transporter substrate-binding protein [Sphaerochaetaceae bacterium]
MKRFISVMLLLLIAVTLFARGVSEVEKVDVICSTSWTAAFADLAGVDDLDSIAPANLRHPPEYELVPSDIVKVRGAKVFISAGYEKMMDTIKETIANEDCTLVKISTQNSIEKIKSETEKISKVTGTKVRIEDYIKTVEEGAAYVSASSKGKKVFCHSMQIYLAKDLGLEIVGTYGPAPATAEQIKACKESGANFIIDNVHNPIASPLKQASGLEVVVWRNFPEKVEKGALTKVVKDNIEALKSVL